MKKLMIIILLFNLLYSSNFIHSGTYEIINGSEYIDDIINWTYSDGQEGEILIDSVGLWFLSISTTIYNGNFTFEINTICCGTGISGELTSGNLNMENPGFGSGSSTGNTLQFTYEPPTSTIYVVGSYSITNGSTAESDEMEFKYGENGSWFSVPEGYSQTQNGEFGAQIDLELDGDTQLYFKLVSQVYGEMVSENTVTPVELSLGGVTYSFDLQFTYESSQLLGDINFDNEINIVDVVNMVSLILQDETLTDEQLLISDMNQDGVLNVVDIVLIVDYILD